ncbi:hypothetical protein [Tardiphaga sp. 768_D3_N2_1]
MPAALRHGHGGTGGVGTPTNAAEARAVTHPGKAKTVFAALFEKVAAK